MVQTNSQQKTNKSPQKTPFHEKIDTRDLSMAVKLASRTTGIPMMSISVPDPTISATISNNPMPAARAKDVETAGRTFLCWLAFLCGIKKSSPRQELNTNQRDADNRASFRKQTELFMCLLCPVLLEVSSIACCSATKDVVTLSNGTLNSLDTKLKTEADAPTAAS